MIRRLRLEILRFAKDPAAAAMAEYMVTLAILAAACIGAMTALGNSIGNLLVSLGTAL
jgi:Flp pilus assembly pilin Flp